MSLFDNLLSAQEIKDRLDHFNEHNDWAIFNDVPEIQQVNVMYPHRIDVLSITAKAEEKSDD